MSAPRELCPHSPDSHALSQPINSPVPACGEAPRHWVGSLTCSCPPRPCSACWAAAAPGAPGRGLVGVLTVPIVGPCGSWDHEQFCPRGYAMGFELKVQPFQGFWLFGDDTCSAWTAQSLSPPWGGEQPSLSHPSSGQQLLGSLKGNQCNRFSTSHLRRTARTLGKLWS
ncbi:uncharacterized protein LOC111924156 isoform X2 [Cyanistes caeruleus]|uniref:uncharacterized protein LOC111924156 isoform X2 n=1 Tax=Cyanistes caeruleus TaxID=156563 RepID=UPI000CDB1BDE|nr:uncharacterized protein LOC111924156 isoform X2 [Cyanistes caeruleus]